MSPLKFAANLSTMYKEYDSLIDRWEAARKCGFSACEIQFPYDYGIDNLKCAQEKTQLEAVLINTDPGDISKGEFGFTTKPHYQKEFKNSLEKSIQYANALNCKMIHILAGNESEHIKDDDTESTYVENLQFAVDALEREGIMAVIEPITKVTKPFYFLNDFKQAVRYIKKVDSRNLKLLLDVFHLQMICGNLTNNIKELFPYVGHIQVSQAPNRYEPGAEGEINYRYIFSLLEELGYDGWIGLEYTPLKDTKNSLKWIEEFQYKL